MRQFVRSNLSELTPALLAAWATFVACVVVVGFLYTIQNSPPYLVWALCVTAVLFSGLGIVFGFFLALVCCLPILWITRRHLASTRSSIGAGCVVALFWALIVNVIERFAGIDALLKYLVLGCLGIVGPLAGLALWLMGRNGNTRLRSLTAAAITLIVSAIAPAIYYWKAVYIPRKECAEARQVILRGLSPEEAATLFIPLFEASGEPTNGSCAYAFIYKSSDKTIEIEFTVNEAHGLRFSSTDGNKTADKLDKDVAARAEGNGSL
jgi:hypothetical protein